MKQIPDQAEPPIQKTITIEANQIGGQSLVPLRINIKAPNIRKIIERKKCHVSPPHQSKITVNYDIADCYGKWSWSTIRDWKKTPQFDSLVKKFHVDYHEKKTWGIIDRERSHGRKRHFFYKKNQIVREAQKRLGYLRLDDFEEVFRFRLSTNFRFYGTVAGNTFLALWHDPNHKICKEKN